MQCLGCEIEAHSHVCDIIHCMACMQGFQQQDSHELLRVLLDGLQTEEAKAIAAKLKHNSAQQVLPSIAIFNWLSFGLLSLCKSCDFMQCAVMCCHDACSSICCHKHNHKHRLVAAPHQHLEADLATCLRMKWMMWRPMAKSAPQQPLRGSSLRCLGVSFLPEWLVAHATTQV